MKKIFFTLLIMLAAVTGFAQQEYDSIADSSKADPNVVVGAIGGTVDVSALGGAVYTIPIQVPEGIAGMQPNLSIVYNSQSGNGLLGWGWNLGGVSAITRTGANLYHDGYKKGVDFGHSVFDPKSFDRFALDGQRLMLTKGLFYGENNSEYKTEIDGMSKIIAHTDNEIVHGPGWFEVYTADGTIIEYGKEGARMVYESDNGGKEVAFWLINRIVDRNGNYILYSYEIGGAHYALKKIEYVRNDDLNLPYWNYVEFGYENRKDKEISFIGNHTLKQIYLLKSISIKDQNGQELWKYAFGYKEPQPYEAKKFTYKKLESINFTCGNEKYTPTIITWGGGYGYSCDNYYIDGENAQNTFVTGFKFSGDFNGDGRTDFIGMDAKQSGKLIVYRSGGEGCFYTATTLPKDDNLDWVYVADLNDDGLDDVICSSRERFENPYVRDKVFLDFFIAKVNDDGDIDFERPTPRRIEYNIRHKHQETLLIGDFLGNGRTCVISQACKTERRETDGSDTINEEKDWGLFSYLITLDDNNHLLEEDISGLVPQYHSFLAADFNGDGITEIYCCDKDNNTTKIIRLGRLDYMIWQQEVSNSLFTKYHTLFPGDFNGDGKIDLLTFADDGNDGGSWQINYFKENELYWPQIDITSKMPFLNPGNQGLSMRGRVNGNYKFVRVSDFDGDGKSDIAVIKDAGMPMDSLVIFYGPLVENDAGNMEFSQRRSYNVVANALPYHACIGNFFGKENVSVIKGYRIFKATPLTDRYNVESITDGMNNCVSFEYDYLIAKQRPSASDFYVRSHRCESVANHIRPCSLPIKALKKQTSSNGNLLNTTTEFQYENVMLHTKGKGLLGFASATVSKRNNGRYAGKVVKESDVSSMGEHCMLLPAKETAYGPHNTKMSESVSQYTKLKCLADMKGKVVIPVIKRQITDNYDLSDNETFLKRSIVENEYDQTDYQDVVKIITASSGVSARTVNSVGECEFRNRTEMKYYDDETDSWIINRPYTKKNTQSMTDGDDVESLTVFKYEENRPTLLKSIETYPSGEISDQDWLAASTSYTYDRAGNVETETLKAINDNALDSRMTAYKYDGFRYLKSESNPMGHTDTYDYHFPYGELKMSTDCNGMWSEYSYNGHLGMGSVCRHIDGTESHSQKYWYDYYTAEPYRTYGRNISSKYYSVTRSTGQAENIVYYDAFGRVRREVSFGLTLGDIIFKDTEYDAFGRVKRESEPYFYGEDPENVNWVRYTYDDYDRLKKTDYPDGTYCETLFSGLTTTTISGKDDTRLHYTKDEVNVMGWKVMHDDYLDPADVIVNYGYNADGSLAWTSVLGNEDSKIKIEYDCAGNRETLTDPDYGEVLTHYDAFGQLRSRRNPKGNYTFYHYDKLGRLILRTESDQLDTPDDVTQWKYDSSVRGAVDEVAYNDVQSVSYAYDDLCRLKTVTERLFDVNYKTSYGYDEFGRLCETEYPTSYKVKNVFDDGTGSLVEIRDRYDATLWHTIGANALGQITDYTMGNDIKTTLGYDLMHRLNVVSSGSDENKIQRETYEYDIFGNLAARKEFKYDVPLMEEFRYDDLNRLDAIIMNGTVSEMKYDMHGRIIRKMAEGRDVFSDARYETVGDNGMPKPHAISSASMGNNLIYENHDITYTRFDKVNTIQAPPGTVSFEYGYDRQRTRMTMVNGGINIVKTYVGNCEFVDCFDRITSHTFISGPMGVFAVAEKNDDGESLHYIYKDHLGSWTTITDDKGNIEEEHSFDAWGNFRDPYSWTGHIYEKTMFDRGFTGHEYLYGFDLINMNGRMYDPVMSSFLSVDNYVQSPDNSQNFNRYAYCLNNPLKYTDPDGEWVQYVVGGLLGAWNGYSIGKAAGLTGWEMAGAILGGAAVGAATAGIGNFVSSACGATLGGSAAGAFAGAGNGLIQGLATDSKTLGADVWNGLWKGGVSGLIGGYVGGDCGLYGGKAAFFSGCAANLTGQVCNYVTNADNSINWLSVGLSGLTSFAGYHAMLYQGYCEGGYKNLGVKYGEFSEMMQTIQQSMRSNHEGKYIAYKDPNKKAYNKISPDKNSVTTYISDYLDAKYDMHTHDEFGCDGFSDYARAIQAGASPEQCDWHSAGQLYMKTGYSGPKFLATAEGHFWMMNSCTPVPIVIPNGLGFKVSFSYSWNPQMVTDFNYSHLFHSYQYNFILRF